MDFGNLVMLSLLKLPGHDTVDHNILVHQLQKSYGLCDAVVVIK